MNERTDRYRIERLLAVGGMAELHLAHESLAPGLTRRVAIKRLLPQYRSDDEFVTMFLDEARVAVLLSHPHVLTIHDVCPIDADWRIVMEYIDGTTLGSVLDSRHARQLEMNQALSMGALLAETLHYVHGACDADGAPLGIVHRDLNPANVLMGENGAIKLIDFGIALGEHRVYETATGTTKGTLGYMAPEQLTPGVRVDARTDVFGLGILLYEMLTGRRPFETRLAIELPARIASGQFVGARELRPEVPPALDALISACLRPSPDARPASIAEVARELRALQQDVPPSLADWGALVADAAARPPG